MEKIKILDPVAVNQTSSLAAVPYQKIEGKSIGIISNEWRCVRIMLREIEQALTRKHGVKKVTTYPVEASMPAPKATLDQARRESDAIIVAMAN